MAHIKQFEHLKIQLETIKSATNNFSNEHLIGQGGFGKVYRAEINHAKGEHTVVALKRLNRVFGQGDPEFWKEIMLLSQYRHRNIVSLLGYCDDSGEKVLVYDYVSRKSLDLYLNKDELTWVQRLKICLGAAQGLAYLHTPADTQLRVLHRDIKSSNILLDENWNAKIADFGLSKFAPANKNFTYLISNAVGTFGYCDPVYVETGLLTKESDVYSFGVVLFEVLCGRLCIRTKNEDHRAFIGLVRHRYEENKLDDIIFGNIKDEINPNSLKEFTKIAYQCLRKDREERPLMINVVKALEHALKCQSSDGGVGSEITQIDGILNVTVLRATQLKKRSTFVMLRLTDANLRSIKKTSVKHGNTNPEWNEEFTLYVENPSTQCLEILVHNLISVAKHEFVKYFLLPLSSLTPGEPYTHTTKDPQITIEVLYKPFAYYTTYEDECPVQKAPLGTPRGGGLLVVIIHHAFSVEYYGVLSKSYVSILFRGEIRKTQSIEREDWYRCTMWEEEFTYMLEEPPTNEELRLEITQWNGLKEEFVAHANVSLADVVNKKRINKEEYTLQNKIEKARIHVQLEWRTTD